MAPKVSFGLAVPSVPHYVRKKITQVCCVFYCTRMFCREARKRVHSRHARHFPTNSKQTTRATECLSAIDDCPQTQSGRGHGQGTNSNGGAHAGKASHHLCP